MAIKDWPAGFITKDQVVPAGNYEDSAASGIWTLDQVANYVKQNLWPTAGNVLSLHYIAQVDGTYKTDFKYFNFGTSGNILYGQPNEQTSKYVIEMTSDGTTVNAEIQYTGDPSQDISENGVFHTLPFECVQNSSTEALKITAFTGEANSDW